MNAIKWTIYTNEIWNGKEVSKVQCISKNPRPKTNKQTKQGNYAATNMANASFNRDNKNSFSKSPKKFSIYTAYKTEPRLNISGATKSKKTTGEEFTSKIIEESNKMKMLSPSHLYSNKIGGASLSSWNKSKSPIKGHSNTFTDKANKKITSSINQIIDLKAKITSLKTEEDTLIAQKDDIMNHFEHAVIELKKDISERIHPIYENEPFIVRIKNLKEEYDSLLSVYYQASNHLNNKEDELNDYLKSLQNEETKFEEQSTRELNDLNEFIRKATQNSISLTENDINSINLWLRIILLSLLDWTKETIMSSLITKEEQTFDEVINNWWYLINNTNKKNKKWLKAYFQALTSCNIGELKDTFYNTINVFGSVNYNRSNNINYANSIRFFYADNSERIISMLKEKDINGTGVISFDAFLQILIENSNDNCLSDAIFEYIIFIMKDGFYNGNYYLWDLGYTNFVNLLLNNDDFIVKFENEEQYKDKIKEYLSKTGITFSGWVSECKNQFLLDEEKRKYLRVEVFSKWLRNKGIIAKNKIVPKTGEIMNVNLDEMELEFDCGQKRKEEEEAVDNVFSGIWQATGNDACWKRKISESIDPITRPSGKITNQFINDLLVSVSEEVNLKKKQQ